MKWAGVVLSLSVASIGAAVRLAWATSRCASVAGRLAPSAAAAGGGALRTGDQGRRRRLRPPAPPGWLDPALVDAALDVPARTAWYGWLGAVALTTSVAGIVSGAAAAVLSILATGGLPLLALRSRRGRAASQIERELPAALESIARSLRSGASVRHAIAEAATSARGFGPAGGRGAGGGNHRGGGGGGGGGAGRLRTELTTVADQAGHGAGLVEALEGLAARRPGPGMRLAVAALCLGVDTGGAQARAVDGVAATMRERLAVEAEVRALSSQARMSALVIGLAPLGFGVFAAATDPRTSDFLLRTPGGLILVCVGLLLDGAGWLWMQRLCRVAA